MRCDGCITLPPRSASVAPLFSKSAFPPPQPTTTKTSTTIRTTKIKAVRFKQSANGQSWASVDSTDHQNPQLPSSLPGNRNSQPKSFVITDVNRQRLRSVDKFGDTAHQGQTKAGSVSQTNSSFKCDEKMLYWHLAYGIAHASSLTCGYSLILQLCYQNF